jgi:hypothetical protein
MGGTVSLVPGLNTASCSVGTEAPGGLGCVSYMGGTVCLYQKKSMENFDDVHCVCVVGKQRFTSAGAYRLHARYDSTCEC